MKIYLLLTTLLFSSFICSQENKSFLKQICNKQNIEKFIKKTDEKRKQLINNCKITKKNIINWTKNNKKTAILIGSVEALAYLYGFVILKFGQKEKLSTSMIHALPFGSLLVFYNSLVLVDRSLEKVCSLEKTKSFEYMFKLL
ncbi:hypothetical protein M1446_03615 [Candidatus Dependentiae bacterium]|nr:hypothetical protein [Candidatus Dependentiae bacterium]